ncbi:MAG: outer membrane protein assembly factor BamD [Vicinamibacterales bacterium]
MVREPMTTRAGWRALTLALACAVAACGGERAALPPGSAQADQFLFERGSEALKEKKWLPAREYFRQIVDNYPQSPYRPDAKLAVGDTYIGEHTTESLMLAVNEFREFQTFYPTNPRADYAQYRLAYAVAEQMLAPERDQTNTKEAIKELQVFLDRYPNSPLMPEAQALMRRAKDRLSEAGYRVGFYYFRAHYYPGAIDRFKEVLKEDPGYTKRDAVYYHLGESLLRQNLPTSKAEALPYFERLLSEFEQSSYLESARRRVEELKGASSEQR